MRPQSQTQEQAADKKPETKVVPSAIQKPALSKNPKTHIYSFLDYDALARMHQTCKTENQLLKEYYRFPTTIRKLNIKLFGLIKSKDIFIGEKAIIAQEAGDSQTYKGTWVLPNGKQVPVQVKQYYPSANNHYKVDRDGSEILMTGVGKYGPIYGYNPQKQWIIRPLMDCTAEQALEEAKATNKPLESVVILRICYEAACALERLCAKPRNLNATARRDLWTKNIFLIPGWEELVKKMLEALKDPKKAQETVAKILNQNLDPIIHIGGSGMGSSKSKTVGDGKSDLYHLPPDAVADPTDYDERAEVFRFGIFLFEMWLQIPWEKFTEGDRERVIVKRLKPRDNKEIQDAYNDKWIAEPDQGGCPAPFYEIVQVGCWQIEANRRPSFSHIRKVLEWVYLDEIARYRISATNRSSQNPDKVIQMMGWPLFAVPSGTTSSGKSDKSGSSSGYGGYGVGRRGYWSSASGRITLENPDTKQQITLVGTEKLTKNAKDVVESYRIRFHKSNKSEKSLAEEMGGHYKKFMRGDPSKSLEEKFKDERIDEQYKIFCSRTNRSISKETFKYILASEHAVTILWTLTAPELQNIIQFPNAELPDSLNPRQVNYTPLLDVKHSDDQRLNLIPTLLPLEEPQIKLEVKAQVDRQWYQSIPGELVSQTEIQPVSATIIQYSASKGVAYALNITNQALVSHYLGKYGLPILGYVEKNRWFVCQQAPTLLKVLEQRRVEKSPLSDGLKLRISLDLAQSQAALARIPANQRTPICYRDLNESNVYLPSGWEVLFSEFKPQQMDNPNLSPLALLGPANFGNNPLEKESDVLDSVYQNPPGNLHTRFMDSTLVWRLGLLIFSICMQTPTHEISAEDWMRITQDNFELDDKMLAAACKDRWSDEDNGISPLLYIAVQKGCWNLSTQCRLKPTHMVQILKWAIMDHGAKTKLEHDEAIRLIELIAGHRLSTGKKLSSQQRFDHFLNLLNFRVINITADQVATIMDSEYAINVLWALKNPEQQKLCNYPNIELPWNKSAKPTVAKAFDVKVSEVKKSEGPIIAMEVGDKINAGSYGTVYKGIFKGRYVAVKLSNATLSNEPNKEDFLNENKPFISLLNHGYFPTIVDIYGIGYIENNAAFIMERLAQSLAELLSNNAKENKILKLSYGLKYANHIASAINYLHKHHIVHGNLHTGNVLLSGDYQTAKVSYYGFQTLKRLTVSCSANKINLTSLAHYSPERLTQSSSVKKDEKIDIYSFGIILYQLVFGVLPFNAQTRSDLVKDIRKGIEEKIPQKLTEEQLLFKDLILKCCTLNPAHRPNITQILSELVRIQPIFDRLTREQMNKDKKDTQPELKADAFVVDPSKFYNFQTNLNGRDLGIYPASEADTKRVDQLLTLHPLENFERTTVSVIYNLSAAEAFYSALTTTEARVHNRALRSELLEPKEQRKEIKVTFESNNQNVAAHPDYPNVKLFPGWLKTPSDMQNKLSDVKEVLQYALQKHDDCLGKGFYLIQNANLLLNGPGKEISLIFAYCQFAKGLPILPSENRTGQNNYGDFDAHLSLGDTKPLTRQATVFQPQQVYCQLLVNFQRKTLLPAQIESKNDKTDMKKFKPK